MTRRRVLALAVVAPLLAWTVAPAPASAAQDPDTEVALSTDGTTWAEDITTPLLDPDMLWVPGDAEVATLWFRNESDTAAEGYAEVTVGPEDAALAEDLIVRTRYDEGGWSPGAVSPAMVVAAGQVVRLDVEVGYDPASGNESMDQMDPLGVRVVLAADDAQAGPAPAPAGPATDPGPGPGPADPDAAPPADEGLAVTGANVFRTAAAAFALVIIGAWLVVAVRRREVRDE